MVKATMVQARIYINRQEIGEAIEAYGDYLNEPQKQKLRAEIGESDFWLFLNYRERKAELYIIEDEG